MHLHTRTHTQTLYIYIYIYTHTHIHRHTFLQITIKSPAFCGVHFKRAATGFADVSLTKTLAKLWLEQYMIYKCLQ